MAKTKVTMEVSIGTLRSLAKLSSRRDPSKEELEIAAAAHNALENITTPVDDFLKGVEAWWETYQVSADHELPEDHLDLMMFVPELVASHLALYKLYCFKFGYNAEIDERAKATLEGFLPEDAFSDLKDHHGQ